MNDEHGVNMALYKSSEWTEVYEEMQACIQ